MSPNSIPNLKLLHLVTPNSALLIELFYHASPKLFHKLQFSLWPSALCRFNTQTAGKGRQCNYLFGNELRSSVEFSARVSIN